MPSGYVVKPMVGRWGDNLSLFGADHHLLQETSGKFSQQDQIYQQLCLLPRVDDKYVQLSAFSVAGHFGGICTRIEPTPVITWASELWPLRILDDERNFISSRLVRMV